MDYFFVPDATNATKKVCPFGHARQWMWVVLAIVLPSIPLFVLNELKYLWQSQPTRSVTTSDQRFWLASEIPKESVSTVLLFVYVLLIPAVVISTGILGAAKRDLELRQRKNNGGTTIVVNSKTKDIPFRGWAIGIYVLVNWADLLVTVVLKYYNHQMRPKSLAECHHVLKGLDYNMSTYVGTLAQLKLCCTHDPNLFQGYPSGHSSMAFCGLFGFGVLLTCTDWLLEGLAHVLCCCRSGDEALLRGIVTKSQSREATSISFDGNDTETTTQHAVVEGDLDPLFNHEEGVGDCGAKIGSVGMHVLKGFVLLLTGALAAMIACSRVNDGSHFPYQVTAGSLLGLVGAACFTSSALLLKDVELGGAHQEGTKIVTSAKTSRSRHNAGRNVGISSSANRTVGEIANISEQINIEMGTSAGMSPESRARKRNTVM
jgi:membrane-associated phospholipid phosphatase